MVETETSQPPRSKEPPSRILRYFLAAAGILGGVFVLMQVGFMMGRSSLDQVVAMYERRVSALEDRLTALQDAKSQSTEELRQKLERAQEVSAALRAELQKSDRRDAAAESQLKEAKRTISRLQELIEKVQSERDAAQATLTATRPFLHFWIETKDDLKTTEFHVTNKGNSPVRLTHSTGQSWINGRAGELARSSIKVFMPPGKNFNIFQFYQDSGLAEEAKRGESNLRHVVCLIYESALDNDPRRWMLDVWFEYNHEENKYYFSTNNDRPTTSSTSECGLENLMPQGWLSDG